MLPVTPDASGASEQSREENRDKIGVPLVAESLSSIDRSKPLSEVRVHAAFMKGIADRAMKSPLAIAETGWIELDVAAGRLEMTQSTYAEFNRWLRDVFVPATEADARNLPPRLAEVRRQWYEIADDVIGDSRDAIDWARRHANGGPVPFEDDAAEAVAGLLDEDGKPLDVEIGRDGRIEIGRRQLRDLLEKQTDKIKPVSLDKPVGNDGSIADLLAADDRLSRFKEEERKAKMLKAIEVINVEVRSLGKAYQSAWSYIRSEGTREECARRLGVTVDELRGAESKLRDRIEAVKRNLAE